MTAPKTSPLESLCDNCGEPYTRICAGCGLPCCAVCDAACSECGNAAGDPILCSTCFEDVDIHPCRGNPFMDDTEETEVA